VTAVLHIFDVSAYQGTTVPVADAVFVKATEGKSYVSAKFKAQYASAKTRAKHRGGYHFARPEESSYKDQAARFLDVVQPRVGESVWLDLEASKLTQSETNIWARNWGEYIWDQAPGVTSGSYLGRGYVVNNTGRGLSQHFDRWWYPQYPGAYQLMGSADEEQRRAANRSSLVAERIPIVAMTTKWPPALTPSLPAANTTGWSRPDIWQFTDNMSGLDASVSALTLDQLATGGHKPIPTEVDMISGKITAGKGQKDSIELAEGGPFHKVKLGWDNTRENLALGITRKPPASFRLAMHQPGRKGTSVPVTVGATLDDTKGWADSVVVPLPAGCDRIDVERNDDGDASVSFCAY
jgi:hypothetical protein